ncbi:MAG: DUF169 domain-containing protein [Oscillospiraceae bacterium]|nr:DUF169 domain-containing protein [Oscillospiraceae bacterium]
MLTLEQIHEIGRELESIYCLKNAPMAIRLVNRDEVPEDCVQPSAQGKHYALCQTLSYVRRTRKAQAIFPEDHWCLWPVINFRLRDLDEQDKRFVGSGYFIRDRELSYKHFVEEYPYIDEDKKRDGMVIAPLESCSFEPQAVMIYCDPSQLRQLLMAAKWHSGRITQACLDTCDSCGAALVPVLNGAMDYNLSMPDAGEYERGLVGENEMIFTLTGKNLEVFIESARQLIKAGFSYKQLAYELHADYPRPKFYNDMFEKWGLATSDDLWTPSSR